MSQLRDACSTREEAIRDARRALQDAQLAHRNVLDDAEEAFDRLINPPYIEVLGAVGLAANRITIGEVTHLLEPGVRARADTKGAMTRVADIGGYGGGIMATLKTKKYDDREMVILVEGGDWAEIAVFQPKRSGWGSGKRNTNLQQAAVRLAKRIEVTADAVPAWRAGIVHEAAELARKVKIVAADTAAIDAAHAHLDQATAMPEIKALVAACDDIDQNVLTKEQRLTIDRARRLVAVPVTLGPPPPPRRGRQRTLGDEWERLRDFESASDARSALSAIQSGLGKMLSGNTGAVPLPPLPLDDWIEAAEATSALTPSGPEADDAGAGTTGAPGTNATEHVEALERLAQLHAAGVLSDEEFAAAKRRVLDL